MRYFLGDDPDPEQVKQNQQYEAMRLRGDPPTDQHNGPQYRVVPCCGKAVNPTWIQGCICPHCGRG